MTGLELVGVCKSFDEVPAVDHADLRVPAGSLATIVGASGCGKTTILRMIAGFEVPDAGRIVLDGQPLVDATRFTPPHQRSIGYVPQEGALFPHLSVGENVAFGMRDRGDARARRIRELMDMAELDARLVERRPHELSGGQQQRVALARALANRPRLMLLDEPFSALDAGLRAQMRRAVAHLLRQVGITTILVTHDQMESLSFGDQLAVMRDGAIVQAGAPTELYRYPRDEETALFLGEGVILDAHVDDGVATSPLGRVRVGDARFTGPARILLRPSQVVVGARRHDVDGGRTGVIVGTEFNGESLLLTLALDPPGTDRDAPQTPTTIVVRSAADATLADGAAVTIRLTGVAHVLEPRPA